ncbi:MAG: hypothetical protein P4L26_16130, partial [Terracidiphilus sp.]|nr:hypothetical protein [Terracidiphilus sp.]
MKQTALLLTVALLAAPAALFPQSPSPVKTSSGHSGGPFSEIALGGGIGSLGIQLQAATNLSSHFNLRGNGDFFNYSRNFTSNGLSADAKLNLASAGAAVDIYPFRVGFRLSPGVLFYNQNQLTAAVTVPAGSSFKLSGTTYYSANTNAGTGAAPVNGTGTLGLNINKAAFTVTTGWGNMIPRHGHFSVPFEVGVAIIGAPTVNVNLGGWACLDQAQTECSNLADPTNPIAIAVQGNLATQVAKWTSDLKPLNTYPIVSIGVAYSFHVR